MPQKYKRGQMWWYTPGDETDLPRHAQKGRRTVIIVSDDHLNATSTCLLAVACTSKFHRNFPTQIMFMGPNNVVNTARCEQIMRVDINRLDPVAGTVEPYIMEFIDTCLKRSLGLAPAFPDEKPVPEEKIVTKVEEAPKPVPAAPKPVTPNPVTPVLTPPPAPPKVVDSSPFIDVVKGKRRVWDDAAKRQMLADIDSQGVMKTAKKYNLASATIQNYAGKFLRDLHVAH